MKRLINLILCLILILSANVGVYAYNDMQSVANGAYLQVLGILEGNENGLELNKSLTRAEAVVIVIRLSGNEEEAREYKGTMPFSDVPQWASGYVAYAYDTGITNGISDNLFGSNRNVTLNQFAAFMLRVIGYSDGNDFEYSEAYRFANNIGAMKYLAYKGDFKRADAADICVGFMETNIKDENITLYEILKDRGMFSYTDILIADYTKETTLLAGSQVEDTFYIDTLESLIAEEEAKANAYKESEEELRDMLENEELPEPEPEDEEPTEEPVEGV